MKTNLKSILFLVFISICITGFSQTEEPSLPDEGEVPTPETTDGLTSAADAVGKLLQGDPCSEQSYAEQVYCYTGQWLSSIIACGYGRNTPQYTMCESSQMIVQPNAKEQMELKKLNRELCWINPKVRPLYFDSKNGNKAIKEVFSKTRKNTVLHTYKNGHQLKMEYATQLKELKGEMIVKLKITDSKNNIIAKPYLITKNNRTYLFEGCYK